MTHFTPQTERIAVNILTTLAFPVAFAHAQVTYSPMVGLPGIPAGVPTTFMQYAPAVFTLGIGLAGVLAVIMIVVGGLELVASGASESLRSKGRERIGNAITGLIIIAFSWLVLNTINPNLVNVQFSVPASPVVSSAGAEFEPTIYSFCAINSAGEDNCVGRMTLSDCTRAVSEAISDGITITHDCHIPATGPDAISASEEAARGQLSSAGVSVLKAACPDGVRYQDVSGGCTSVGGLPQSTLDKLIDLKKSCGCEVIVTGGSEAGHLSHGVGRPMVDLRKTDRLVTYLNTLTGGAKSGSGCAKGKRYVVDGNTYVDEVGGDPHFHVCY